jgi:hypothetical protein
MPISDKTAYAWREFQRGPCYFKLDDPGNITQLAEIMGTIFLSGGTWTNDGRWLGVDLHPGTLWEVNPKNGELLGLGGGGNELTGLAYNPINSKLYGAGRFSLYEIDIDTGEQTFIGDYGEGPEYMSIAFDFNGILYGWDFFSDSLWNINTETGQVSLIGPLDIDIKHQGDCHFDFGTDTLYLSAITTTAQLYECDEDTGQCTLIGDFENTQMITALAIPYNWPNQQPDAPKIDGPTTGKPGIDYDYTFVATDPDGDDIWYHIGWGDKEIIYIYGPYPSGEELTLSYNWTNKGTYIITCWVIDIYDATSEVSTLEVTIPRTRASSYHWLFEHFPMLERLLGLIRS